MPTDQELPDLSKSDLIKGVVAPDFTIISYPVQPGKPQNKVSLRDFEGTPLILNFWAGSCPPCRAEMPDFQDLHEDLSDQLSIIGIDVGQFSGLGTPEQAEELINQVGVTYLTGYALSPDIMKDYKVISMPTTIFIDAEGSVVREWSGMIDRETLFDLGKTLIPTG
ncbi:MAG: TlpA disulfide reductase family protein [Chloroflexota bacterium]|nr:TlpA disulfide reductase family protein [Chloroflexota bacterium]